jgi:hypothetical protein
MNTIENATSGKKYFDKNRDIVSFITQEFWPNSMSLNHKRMNEVPTQPHKNSGSHSYNNFCWWCSCWRLEARNKLEEINGNLLLDDSVN